MTTTMLIHDLKSPVAALDTLIYSLADRLGQDEMDLAQIALTRIKDKFKLIKNKNQKEWVDIVKLLEEVIAEKQVLFLGRKINLNLQLNQTFFTKLFLEPIEFKRIISNLIENSREAMPKGGNIVVRLKVQSGFLHIQVRDDGEGMEPDTLRLVKHSGGTYHKKDGSGHGLQHAKQKLHEWGGQLEIDSLQGIGSIVTLKLPLNTLSKPLEGVAS